MKSEQDESSVTAGSRKVSGRVIVLMRHGPAEDASEERPDEERALTDEGHARMKLVARGLAVALGRPAAIITSPLVRCTQTARWVSRAYRGKPEPDTADILAPATDLDALESFVRGLPEKRTVLIGHEPTLSLLAERLLGIRESGTIHFGKGGACAIRVEEDGAKLEWLMTPKALRSLGSR
jgi:phosphohistidine phosphatase